MQIVSCPSCGAQVEFRSHAAVMAVCEYCRATILKDGGSVTSQGKMAEVLEDYSPIQLGTSGVFAGRGFTVIGRIQLRYEAGFWNEWYLLFDDGSAGWLGDASGQYMVTIEREPAGDLPRFADIDPGSGHMLGGQHYIAADKRTATCTGGQGELPFVVGEGWEARVADLRAGANFVTLDYSDVPENSPAPAVYSGHAVTLPGLKAQLLRDDEQIKASAGRYRGKLSQLDCPSCGSMIRYLPGVTANLVCPGCASALDAASPKAQVLKAGEKLEEKLQLSLPLGAKAKVPGRPHTVIGALVRTDDEEAWTEYLLYSNRGTFFWLVESPDGWFRADVLDSWPAWHSLYAQNITLDNADYTKTWDYNARVVHAAGAFNWRVQAGDQARVIEFEHGQSTLSAELTPQEMTWSRSTPLADDQVKAWFGDVFRGKPHHKPKAGEQGKADVGKFIVWLLMLNAIPLLVDFWTAFIPVGMGLLALIAPPKFLTGKK